ncbi:MAG: RNA degradosome polyphosphate kinase, partial [Dehalococcoidia bacterium]
MDALALVPEVAESRESSGADDFAAAPAARAALPGNAAPGVAPLAPVHGAPESAGPARFFNRELSWIAFNERVFAEAQNTARPLLERVKFLAIYSSNLDEFMMVRLPALRSKVQAGVSEPGPDGIPPQRLLTELRETVSRCLAAAAEQLRDVLVPALAEQGIFLVRYE